MTGEICIYLFSNNITDMHYVGQTKDLRKRISSHTNGQDGETPLHKAIKQYGLANFTIEVLEEGLSKEEADIAERKWILHYNSIARGYNYQTGGSKGFTYEGRPMNYLTEEAVEEIKRLWKETSLSSREIARKMGVNKSTALKINAGALHPDEKENYPLRDLSRSGLALTQEEVDEIHDLLKYSYLFHSEIAAMYGVEKTVVLKIERGATAAYRKEGEDYPLRDYSSKGAKPLVTYDQVTEIHDLLVNTDFSMREIQKLTGVTYQTVMSIKNGRAKRYRRKEYEYPLRSNQYSNKNKQ